jgi:hypothetical protein
MEYIHAVHGLQERGLARIGRPDDAEDLVLPDIQRDPLQGGISPVTDRQVADLELGARRA